MGLARRPRFVLGSLDLELIYPAKAWLPIQSTIGGRRRVASGSQATYRIRTDDLLNLTLRMTEDEWPFVRDTLAEFQEGEAFTFYPDADDAMTSWEVDLETPAMGEDIAPTRDGGFERNFLLDITLRGVDQPPWMNYFED